MKLNAYNFSIWSALLASIVLILALLLSDNLSWIIFVACALQVIATGLLLGDRNPVQSAPVEGGIKISANAPLTFSALLSGFPDPVLLTDKRGMITHVNKAAKALFPTLAETRPLAIFIRAPAILDGVEAVLNGAPSIEAEFREHSVVERMLQAHITPIFAEGKAEPEGVMLVIRNLTSARRLERMRVDFIANASHELRTPLASLTGFIETLQGAARHDEKARERFLVIMREQARRMSRLIDDLLSLSRIEMHLHVPPNGIVEMQAVIHHTIETLSPLAQERSMSVTFQGPADSLLVKGDRDELLQVIQNLVENAIKYGQSGRKVDISLQSIPSTQRRGEEDVVMDVRDYGPGIPPEHLPRLTERFYRADVSDSRDKGGTGLGLAIVKHIVNRHRGRIEISSAHGEGSTFRVILPRIKNKLEMPFIDTVKNDAK